MSGQQVRAIKVPFDAVIDNGRESHQVCIFLLTSTAKRCCGACSGIDSHLSLNAPCGDLQALRRKANADEVKMVVNQQYPSENQVESEDNDKLRELGGTMNIHKKVEGWYSEMMSADELYRSNVVFLEVLIYSYAPTTRASLLCVPMHKKNADVL